MFILKLVGKILLLPVWLILFVIGLAVKMTVQTYAVVRGILGFIFTCISVFAECNSVSDPFCRSVRRYCTGHDKRTYY